MKITQWLLPILTGLLLINLIYANEGFLFWAGVVFGAFYLYAGLALAYLQYVKD